jgi:hypothetical protein
LLLLLLLSSFVVVLILITHLALTIFLLLLLLIYLLDLNSMDMLKSTRKKNNLLLHLPTNLTLKLPHIPDRLALFAVRQLPRLVVLAKPARPARTPLVVAHSHDSVGARPVFVGICGRRVGRVAGDLSTSVTGAVGRRERAGCVEVVADMPYPTSQGGEWRFAPSGLITWWRRCEFVVRLRLQFSESFFCRFSPWWVVERW